MNELANRLKVLLVESLRKNPQIADEPYVYMEEKNYSRNEVAHEIEKETEIGVDIMNSILLLALDLFSRNKK